MIRALIFCAAIVVAGVAKADIVLSPSGDPAMGQAIETARSTLPQFFATFGDKYVAEAQTHLKVSFPLPSGAVTREVIWVDSYERTSVGFVGRLANQPEHMAGLSEGDAVRFSEDLIVDWGFWGPDGLLYGHYTTRVIAEQLPAADVANLRSILSTKPLPEWWE